MSNKKAQVYITAVNETQKTLKEVQRDLAITQAKFKEMGDKANNSLTSIKSSFQGLNAGISTSAIAVAGLATAFVAFKTVLSSINQIKQSFDFVDNMSDAAEAVGMTTNQFLTLSSAANSTGVSTEKFSSSINKLNGLLADASSGSEEAVNKLKSVGLAIKPGEIITSNEALLKISEAFKNAPNDINKTRVAMDLFGKSGPQLIPFLNNGASGIEELTKKMEELGVSISTRAQSSIKSFNDSIDILSTQIKTKFSNLSSIFAPAAELLSEFGQKFLQTFANIDDQSILDLQVSIATFVAEGLIELEKLYNYIIGPLVTVWENLNQALSPIIDEIKKQWDIFKQNLEIGSVFEKIVTYIQGIGKFIGTFITNIIKIVNPLFELFRSLGELIGVVIGSIVNILFAFKNDMDTIVKNVASIVVNLMDIFINLGKVIGNTLMGSAKLIKAVFTLDLNAAKEALLEGGKNITNNFQGVINNVKKIANGAGNIINGGLANTTGAIVNGFNETLSKLGNSGSKLADVFFAIGEGISDLAFTGFDFATNFDEYLKRNIDKVKTNSKNYGINFVNDWLRSINIDPNSINESIRNKLAKEKVNVSVVTGKSLKPYNKEAVKELEDQAKAEYEAKIKYLSELNKQEQKNYNTRIEFLNLYKQANYINVFEALNLQKQYFDETNKNNLDLIDQEIKLTQKRIDHTTDLKEKIKLTEKLKELELKRSQTEIEYSKENVKNWFAQIEALKVYNNELKNLDSRIAELSGNKRLSQEINLELKFDNLLEKYKGDEQWTNKVLKLKELETLQLKINNGLEDYNTALDTLSISEERIFNLQKNGRLSEIETLQQLSNERKKQIPIIEEEINKLKELYKLNPTQENINKLSQLQNKLEDLKDNLDPLAQKFDQIFGDAFARFFEDVATGTKSIKEAFADLTKSIATEITKMAAQDLAKKFMRSIFGDESGENSIGSWFSKLFGGSSSGGSGGSGGGGLFGNLFGGSGSGGGGGLFGNLFGGGGSGGGGGGLFSGIGDWFSGLFGGFFAGGGDIAGNKAYMVGESGKEIFIPKQPGYIMNASRTYDIMKSGGGGSNQNIVINIQASDVNSFRSSEGNIAAQIQRALSKGNRNL